MNEITPPNPALAAPALSKASFKPLSQCATLGEAFASIEFKDRIASAAPAHIKPGRLLQTFIGAVSKYPLLRECSVRSYIGACLTLSQTGFEANTALGHAYLIPFREYKRNPKTRQREPVGVNVNVIFGYPGLIDLSYRTGLVRNIHPDVVFPGDEFSFEYGSNAHLKHVPRQRREGDTPLFAYMHAGLKDGQAFEVMPYGDVLAIRNKSQAYRYALEAKQEAEEKGNRPPPSWTEAPWVAHEFAMARKTAVRAGSKWLPRSVELYSALAIEDAQERRGIDFGNVMDAPTIDGSPDYLSAATESERQEDPPPVDPGTAHGLRTNTTTQVNAPDKATLAREQAEQAAKAAEARKAKPATTPSEPATTTTAKTEPTTQEAPAFEAVLIDDQGEVSSEPFTTAPDFARAFMVLWHECDDEGQLALREHNEDALTEAALDPAAAAILAEMDESPLVDSAEDAPIRPTVEPKPEVVEPPSDRGKISWPGYLKLIKQALTLINLYGFSAWCEAQRANLERCPAAQRVLAVRAIAETAGLLRAQQPAFLADLIRAKPTPASETAKPETNAAPSVDDPAEEPKKSRDEEWVDKQIMDLAGVKDRATFTAITDSVAVRTVMARLRRDNRALFDRADQAFVAKHGELPDAKGG
jgi:recombination protein RecT